MHVQVEFLNLALFLTMPTTALLLAFFIRLFGYSASVAFLTTLAILSNILVLMIVPLFWKVLIPAGVYLYSLTYITTDVIHEVYGYREAKRAVNASVLALALYVIVAVIVTLLRPAPTEDASLVKDLFTITPRVMAASITVYYLSNILDVYVFEKVREKTRGKFLFARNILGEFTADMFDTVTFFFLAFYGVWSLDLLARVVASVLIAKIIMHIVDTPFLYLAVKIARRQ